MYFVSSVALRGESSSEHLIGGQVNTSWGNFPQECDRSSTEKTPEPILLQDSHKAGLSGRILPQSSFSLLHLHLNSDKFLGDKNKALQTASDHPANEETGHREVSLRVLEARHHSFGHSINSKLK